jgi:hypothetical protein
LLMFISTPLWTPRWARISMFAGMEKMAWEVTVRLLIVTVCLFKIASQAYAATTHEEARCSNN